MKKSLICFIALFMVCVLMPLEATEEEETEEVSIIMTYTPFARSPGSSFRFSAYVYVGEDSNPAGGQTVTFSVSPDDGTVSLSPTSATSVSNQSVTTTLSTGSGSSGVYTVTATVGDASASGSATIKAPPPPPELSISVVSGPGSGAPGAALTFTVEVQEDDSAASGKTVTFSITSGDGNASLNPTSATTGTNGRASTTLTLGNSAAGSYTVKATVGTKFTSGTATVETPSPPTQPELSISVVSGPGSGAPGAALTFTVEVQEDDSAASGKTVTFSITSGDGNASLNPTSATTGTNGQASTTLTLGNSAAGSYTLTATVGSTSTSGTATVDTPQLSISVVSGPGSGNPGQGLMFTVEVQEDGSPASGKTVTFSLSPDDGTVLLNPTNVATNSNGRAKTLLILRGGASGSYTVTAAVGSESTSGTATVGTPSPQSPPESSISVVSGPGSGAPGDALTFTVEVQEDGSAASGKTVTFSITSGDGNASLNSTSATTGSNGQASTTLTLGNSASGSYTVTATVGSKSTSGTATVGTPPPSSQQQQEPSPPSQQRQESSPSSQQQQESSPSSQQQQQESLQQPQITTQPPTTIDPPVTTPPVLEPTSQKSISGDNQNGLTGEALANPFVVEVRDQYDAPMEGITVRFTVLAGSGSLSATTAITDANGRAESTLTLGGSPGTNTVEASVEGLSQTAVFSAEAVLPPPIPTALSIFSGDNQNGLTGEALANPFVVEVRDQYDAPMEGITVGFTVLAGSGSLSATTAITDANGRAESTLTLGVNPGANTVTVSVTGLQEKQTLTAQGIRIPKTLEIISGGGQQGLPGSALANPFVVEVRDQSDKPLAGVQVTFSVSSGGGTLSATSVTTDANGRAESTLTLGSNPGANTVTVSISGIQENQTFTAQGIRIPTTLGIISGDDQEGPYGEALENPFIVEVRDQFDEPMPGAEVTFSVTAGGGTLSATSVMTESDGRAESILTLGPDPGTNSVDVTVAGITRTETFTARGIRTPLAFWIISGFDQKGFIGEALPRPIVVYVADRSGEPLPGVQVTFTVTGGGGTLSVTSATTDSDGRAESTLTLGPNPGTNTVEVAVTGIQQSQTATTTAELPPILEDVNRDDVVNFLDLVSVASGLGTEDADLPADVNGDGIVNILDLVLVVSALGNAAAAPSAWSRNLEIPPTRADVGEWLAQARELDLKDATLQLGVLFLEHLLATLTPAETVLFPNYPNPFNPETWIPYGLANDAEVQISIYDINGTLVRHLNLGYQVASYYTERSLAAYWDGRNSVGERVVSGVYFYTLTADDFAATRKMLIGK